MDILNQYKKQIIVTVSAIATIGLGIFIYVQFFTLYVVSVTPSQNATVSYLTPIITATFNKELSDESVDVEIPSGLVTSVFTEGKTLKINIFSGMAANKKYSFTIKSLQSTDGGAIKDHAIIFSTNAGDSLSSADKALILNRQQQNKPGLIQDPIIKYLPHTADDYVIKPYLDETADGKGSITLEITLYLDREGAANKEQTVSRIKQNIQTYLTSLTDVTLSKYTIIYKIQEP